MKFQTPTYKTIVFIVSTVVLLSSNQSFSIEPYWKDPPTSSSFFSTFNVPENYKQIIQSLTDYHKLPKSDHVALSARIAQLQLIVTLLKQVDHLDKPTEYEIIAIAALAEMCEKKAEYLSQIEKLIPVFNDDFNNMKSSFEPSNKRITMDSLELINSISFIPHLRNDIGLFWLEVIDPCHRVLLPYWVKWTKLEEKNSFFLWLEEQIIEPNVSQVKILDKESLTECEVSFNIGKLYTRDIQDYSSKLNDSNEPLKYVFVLMADELLLVSRAQPGVRHVSLSSGKPILSAGELWVHHGKIIKIFFMSGHYRPKMSNYKFFIDYLIKNQADLTGLTQIDYYAGNSVLQASLADFIHIINKEKSNGQET
jgi:hypothetical protein